MKGMPDQATTKHDEWIVQADLPARQVEFARSPDSRRSIPTGITNVDAAERERRLQELFAFLSSIVAEKPVLLRSAGAVSVSATPEELNRISKHPLVKDIKPNRRLH
jgi:hypothetical protein